MVEKFGILAICVILSGDDPFSENIKNCIHNSFDFWASIY